MSWSIGIFAAAKMTHLSDDKKVAKMRHPVVVVRSVATVIEQYIKM